MTITKTILGDQWIVNTAVGVNFHLAVFDDSGKELMRSNPHTITLMPGDDFQAILTAINNDITTRPTMLWPPISVNDWNKVVSHCKIEQTPEVVKAYQAWKKSQTPAA